MKNNFKDISSFDRSGRIGRFKVSNVDETIMDAINNNLSAVDKIIAEQFKGMPRRSIIITGVPRSGTTYLYQLMASKMGFGYVSNLMARFYSAPLVGAWLHNKLIQSEISELSAFDSTHGVTSRVYEPHEFGFFWAQHFPFIRDNHEEVDHTRLSKSLLAMEDKIASIAGIFGRPVLYKCMIAPYILKDILEHTSVFVIHIRRDIDDLVDSILEVRKERLGDYSKWWSIRPENWRELSEKEPREQVRAQCKSVLGAIGLAVSAYPDRIVELEYKNLINNNQATLEHISDRFFQYMK